MDSTWESRDLPVLEAVVEACDRETYADPGAMTRATGLAYEEVQRALRALSAEQPRLFTAQSQANGDIFLVTGATGEARRRVGAWPTPESLADRIVEAVNEAAERTADPERRTLLREAGRALGNVGQAALAGVMANVLTGNPLGPA